MPGMPASRKPMWPTRPSSAAVSSSVSLLTRNPPYDCLSNTTGEGTNLGTIPSRAAVSVTFQPTSSMLSRTSSPRCGGFSIGPTRSLAMSFTVGAPIRSVVVGPTSTASPSSKRNTTRQLPETRTLHWPARSPLRGCSRRPGASTLPGCGASCRRNRIRRSCAAPRYTPQAFAMPSRPAAALREVAYARPDPAPREHVRRPLLNGGSARAEPPPAVRAE